MPTVISLINLKGGVAKTTTTVQLADCLTGNSKRVLVVDLDPQANATESLLGRAKALEVSPNEDIPAGGPNNKNVSQCFYDHLEQTNFFDVDEFICRNTSNLKDIVGPDLLPASLNLLDVQDRLSEIAQKSGYMISPIEVLKFALSPVLDKYDFVLIDCPPSLNLMTRNALEISDYYLVPVINDSLSTRGLYQILKRIEDYAQIRQWKIRCIGILITKYSGQRNLATTFKAERNQLVQKVKARCKAIGITPPSIFNAYMPESKNISSAMDISSSSRFNRIEKKSFAEKYSSKLGEPRQTIGYWIRDITKELVNEIEKDRGQLRNESRSRPPSHQRSPISTNGSRL